MDFYSSCYGSLTKITSAYSSGIEAERPNDKGWPRVAIHIQVRIRVHVQIHVRVGVTIAYRIVAEWTASPSVRKQISNA